MGAHAVSEKAAVEDLHPDAWRVCWPLTHRPPWRRAGNSEKLPTPHESLASAFQHDEATIE
jgi:hypothetical protein